MTPYLLKISLLVILIFNYSFLKKPTSKIDYIIYGIYCGECEGHCSTMFKVEKNQLLIDTTDSFFKNEYKLARVEFKGDTLDRDRFKEAQILKIKVPKLLLQSKDKRFGIPDEYDQCGIYLQIKVDNQLKTFYIDTELKNIPIEIRDYSKLIMKLSRFRPL